MSKTTVKQILLEDLFIDEELYPRSKLVKSRVKQYAEAMRVGAEFPPIVVTPRNGKFHIIDGRHRMESHRELERPAVPSIVKEADDRKAFEMSVEANTKHGERLSEADLKNDVRRLRDFGTVESVMQKITGLPYRRLLNFTSKRMSARKVSKEEMERLKTRAKRQPKGKSDSAGTSASRHFAARGALDEMVKVMRTWTPDTLRVDPEGMEAGLREMRKTVNALLAALRRTREEG